MVGTVNRLNIRCELDTSTNSRHTLGVSKLYYLPTSKLLAQLDTDKRQTRCDRHTAEPIDRLRTAAEDRRGLKRRRTSTRWYTWNTWQTIRSHHYYKQIRLSFVSVVFSQANKTQRAASLSSQLSCTSWLTAVTSLPASTTALYYHFMYVQFTEKRTTT